MPEPVRGLDGKHKVEVETGETVSGTFEPYPWGAAGDYLVTDSKGEKFVVTAREIVDVK